MKDRYSFSKEVKREAHGLANKEFGKHYRTVHHIFPKALARKYNVPAGIVKKIDNAIALTPEEHTWVHEVFDEEDYIFLAIALLGIDEKYFD